MTVAAYTNKEVTLFKKRRKREIDREREEKFYSESPKAVLCWAATQSETREKKVWYDLCEYMFARTCLLWEGVKK